MGRRLHPRPETMCGGACLIRRQARRGSPHWLPTLAAAAHRYTVSSHSGLRIYLHICGRGPLFPHSIQLSPAIRTLRRDFGGDHFLRSLLRSPATSQVPLPWLSAERLTIVF